MLSKKSHCCNINDFSKDYSCKPARLTALQRIRLLCIPLLFSFGRFLYLLNRKIFQKKKKESPAVFKGSGFVVFPSLTLQISNSWGSFLSKMLKFNISKSGGTKDSVFTAILTLKRCNVLRFITQKKHPKTFDLALLIWNSAYASWMESKAISLSQKQIIWDLESPTLVGATRRCAASEALACFTPWNDAVNAVQLSSLSVQTHWRKVESARFVAESDLQWCRLVSVSSESHRPTATAASTCRGEGGEDKNAGACQPRLAFPSVFRAFRHTIYCTFNAMFRLPVNVVKREYVIKLPGWLIGVRRRENCWLKIRRAAVEVCWKMCLTPPPLHPLKKCTYT